MLQRPLRVTFDPKHFRQLASRDGDVRVEMAACADATLKSRCAFATAEGNTDSVFFAFRVSGALVLCPVGVRSSQLPRFYEQIACRGVVVAAPSKRTIAQLRLTSAMPLSRARGAVAQSLLVM
jgi:hypothetical protein